MLLRQCLVQSRLCGGSSALLTEVPALSAFQRVGLCLVFFPGGRVFQVDFLSFLTYGYGGEIVSLFPLVNARCVTTTH